MTLCRTLYTFEVFFPTSSLWKLVEDWKNPYKKQKVLKYNYEDVVNLVRLKKEIFRLYGVGDEYLDLVKF